MIVCPSAGGFESANEFNRSKDMIDSHFLVYTTLLIALQIASFTSQPAKEEEEWKVETAHACICIARVKSRPSFCFTIRTASRPILGFDIRVVECCGDGGGCLNGPCPWQFPVEHNREGPGAVERRRDALGVTRNARDPSYRTVHILGK